MCPGAEQLLGQLGANGTGSDRIVRLGFHVDYFNEPWHDRFSRKQFTEREVAYGRVQKRNDLVFTPMLMVDGRVPMLGTDKAKARKAIAAALAEPPGVTLDLKLEDGPEAPRRKTLNVLMRDPEPDVVDRELLVGVAIFEDRATTHVGSGENAGKRLVEHYPVRHLEVKFLRMEKGGQARVSFPVELDPDCRPAGCGVAAFVQDEQTGHVYQAASIPWMPTSARAGKPVR